MTTLEQGLSEQCVGLQRVAPGCCHHCLSSRGTLILCTSTMADRNGLTYGGPVVPDEVLGDPAETVRAPSTGCDSSAVYLGSG
jgi:hypothetical protein